MITTEVHIGKTTFHMRTVCVIVLPMMITPACALADERPTPAKSDLSRCKETQSDERRTQAREGSRGLAPKT